MAQITTVDMTPRLGRCFEDIMDGHNVLACVYRNRAEVKASRKKDEATEASSLTQTYDDRLRLAKADAVAPPVDLPNFTLAITTFTAEVWAYHGDKCPLYEDLLEWVEELKGGALMNERFDFAPAYLRRTLWKIMIEVDRFYNQECTPEMFERGQGPIPWPTRTKLSSLLSKFMDGDEMKSRSFPEEWSTEFYRKKGLLGSPGGAKGRGGGGGPGVGGGGGYSANGGRGHSGGGYSGSGGGGYSGGGGRGYNGGGGGYQGNQGGGHQGYKPQSPPQGGGRSGNNTAM